jgi:hypothetical protein
MSVGGVVIYEQMHIEMLRNCAIDALAKAEKLVVSMPGITADEPVNAVDYQLHPILWRFRLKDSIHCPARRRALNYPLGDKDQLT